MSKNPTRNSPNVLFGLFSILFAVLLTLVLMQLFQSTGFLWPWLLSINIVTFLVYGYDKLIAGSERRTRTPESILLLLALIGGTFGAVVAMVLFRHKTAKRSFQLKFAIVLIVQVVAIMLYFWRNQ
ncbi:MAG: DUF1294 domain-containing protein [Anaerolineae bacterium]|nr:DUF1294 domain-containing protein [Anaerolineae bacterium]MCO5187604.1 DUF1294 domain-containing protein [Anaerolineae bacterium]MCO5197384.1 DUF1294 domain-containing protein [Anaerolineae bacterium]MCO5204984.1 DUF1294 domain-containing protein [Anaerolineae bacterium]